MGGPPRRLKWSRHPPRLRSSLPRLSRFSAAPARAVVSPRSASSSWTTRPAPSSGTSRARSVRTTSSLSSSPSVRPAASAKRRLPAPPPSLSLQTSTSRSNLPPDSPPHPPPPPRPHLPALLLSSPHQPPLAHAQPSATLDTPASPSPLSSSPDRIERPAVLGRRDEALAVGVRCCAGGDWRKGAQGAACRLCWERRGQGRFA